MIKTNKKKLLKKLQADIVAAQPFKDEWDKKRDKWVAEYNGDPYGNESEGKANVVSRDIKKAAAWQHASFIDPFVVSNDIVNCEPITFEDRNTSEQSELLLNYQFCRQFDRYNFISNSFKVAQREGTVVGKVSWVYEEEIKPVTVPAYMVKPLSSEMEMQQAMQQYPDQAQTMMEAMKSGQRPFVKIQTGTKIEMQTVVKKNQPHVEICRNSMLWVDPTAEGNIKNAQFAAYKFKSNMSELRSSGIDYVGLEKIKLTSSTGTIDRDFEEDPYEKSTDKDFAFSDEARQELDVVEYWGNFDVNGDGIAEPIVCTWVGDAVIRLEENPYPDQELPFVSCAIDSDPFSMNGEANAELIGSDQRIKTGIKRAMLDTLDSSTSGQKGSRIQSLDPVNLGKFRRGEYFEYQGDKPEIWEGKMADIPSDVMNFYGLISNEIESLTAVRPALGSGQASNMSATAARGALDATAKRETDISRNYKENFLIPILRKWFSMDQEFLSDEEVIAVTNEKEVAIRREDIGGNINIGMEVSTPEADNLKSQEISFLLQTTAQSLPFELTKMLLAKQANLKNMPDLAKQIEEYQPQPDPLAQEKAKLEIEKLKAEIAERNSRAAENQVDMRLKHANADLAEARARDYHSGADKKDQEFIDNVSGRNHANDMEKQSQKIHGDLIKQKMSSSAKAGQQQ